MWFIIGGLIALWIAGRIIYAPSRTVYYPGDMIQTTTVLPGQAPNINVQVVKRTKSFASIDKMVGESGPPYGNVAHIQQITLSSLYFRPWYNHLRALLIP